MSNEYFQPGSIPAPNSPGSSATIRGEFNSVSAGFDKLPALAGNADKLIAVDEFGTRLIAANFNLNEIVTLTGVQTLTNKTLAWGDNTFPGFGDAATKNAGTGAGEVLLLAVLGTLPVLSAENLTNIPGLSLKADANNAVLTGAPVAPTPSTGDNSPRIATTQFVQEAVIATGSFAPSNATPLMDGAASAGVSVFGSRDDHRHPSDTSKAPVSAGTATGTSFTPTGGVSATNVQTAIAELDAEKITLASLTATNTTFTPTGGVAATNVQAAIAELDSEKASLASPVLTGDPRAPTPASSDNDTSIATTAYVKTVLAQQPVGMQPSNSSPLMNGTVAPGTGVEGSRHDHVHPVDTSRVAKAGDTMTGNLTGTNFLAPNHQVGVSATPANNFTLDASADNGTMKLARGNAGATTQDIMTVDAAGKVAFPQNKVPVFRASLVATQSFVSGTPTKVVQDTVDFNPTIDFTNGRWTPQVAGYYQVGACNQMLTNAQGTYGYLEIRKSGTAIARQEATYVGNVTTNYGTANVSTLVYMNGTTDYLEVWIAVLAASPFTGGSAALNNFSGALVGAA